MLEHELNDYWKTVVDTIQDGIMIVDNQGVVVSVNKGMERLTGFTSEEMVGQPCSMLNCDICDIAISKGGRHWCALFSTGKFTQRRCKISRKNGSATPILKNASLFHDGKGEIMGAVETFTDISQLVAQDNRIREYLDELK